MSKCRAVSRFEQPGQRHRWGAIKAVTISGQTYELYRDCANLCGAEQSGTEIPANVRRQYEFERSVMARRVARRKSS